MLASACLSILPSLPRFAIFCSLPAMPSIRSIRLLAGLRLNIKALLLSIAAGAAFTVFSSAAEVVVNSQGFENPDYVPGALANQQIWLWTSTAGGGTAEVQTGIVKSGSQAVEVHRGANSNDFWYVDVTGIPTEQFVVIDWDMRVSHTAGGANYGPFFGVEAWYRNISLFGSLGVDAATTNILYQIEGTGNLPTFLVVPSYSTSGFIFSFVSTL